MGEIFDAFGFDPATLVGGVTDGAIGYALYDPLTTYNAAGELEMWLAESVESDDQQTWTITINEGVLFHDGTSFDAEAVKINLERHKDPNTKSRAIGNASNIESVTVIDPTTVEIALKFPWAAFPELLAGNLGLMASPTAIASGTLNTAPGRHRSVRVLRADRRRPGDRDAQRQLLARERAVPRPGHVPRRPRRRRAHARASPTGRSRQGNRSTVRCSPTRQTETT